MPRKRSPSAYSPGPVLKYRCDCLAAVSFASPASCLRAAAAVRIWSAGVIAARKYLKSRGSLSAPVSALIGRRGNPLRQLFRPSAEHGMPRRRATRIPAPRASVPVTHGNSPADKNIDRAVVSKRLTTTLRPPGAVRSPAARPQPRPSPRTRSGTPARQLDPAPASPAFRLRCRPPDSGTYPYPQESGAR